MRLLIATPLYPPELGGPATYTKLLEEGLPAFGIDVAILKFSDVRHLPKVIRHISYMRRLMRMGCMADVILVLDPVSTGLPAALAARFLRKPLVLKVVGDYAWEQGRQRFGVNTPLDEFVRTKNVPWQVGLLRKLESWVARQARTVIVPSEYLKRVVMSWGIPNEGITVVPNGVILTKGGSVPASVENLPHPRIVTVARLVPWKGIDGIIDAVVRVRDAGLEASLTVVGDGPERARLEALARERLQNDTVFTGPLRPEEVHAILKASDIFVLNSTYEGLSHVLLEALTSGTAVVATRAGGNEEVLTDTSGILIPVHDTEALTQTLKDLVQDPMLRERLRSGAQKRSETFRVQAMLERTSVVLSSVI